MRRELRKAAARAGRTDFHADAIHAVAFAIVIIVGEIAYLPVIAAADTLRIAQCRALGRSAGRIAGLSVIRTAEAPEAELGLGFGEELVDGDTEPVGAADKRTIAGLITVADNTVTQREKELAVSLAHDADEDELLG